MLMLTMSLRCDYEESMCDSVQNYVPGVLRADSLDEFRSQVVRRLSLCSQSVVLLCLALVSSAVVCAENDRPQKLLTGRRFRQSLEIRRGLHIENAPLRQVMVTLQQGAGLCVVIDRRIDPSFPLTLNTGVVPTRDLLRQVAAELPCSGLSVNRTFVFIGPKEVSRRLRTLCELNRLTILQSRSHFKPETYAKISTARAFEWAEPESPRELLTALAAQSGLAVVNPEVVPYDLWHAGRLPVMPFAESATLLLIQFDLTFSVDAHRGQCRVVPVPESVFLNRYHRVSRRRRETTKRRLTQEFPGLSSEWGPSGVHVSASYEQHQKIADLLLSASESSGR